MISAVVKTFVPGIKWPPRTTPSASDRLMWRWAPCRDRVPTSETISWFPDSVVPSVAPAIRRMGSVTLPTAVTMHAASMSRSRHRVSSVSFKSCPGDSRVAVTFM